MTASKLLKLVDFDRTQHAAPELGTKANFVFVPELSPRNTC